MLKQPITFYTYCGMAGELDLMLIGILPDGRKATCFFSRVGYFKWLSFYWALIKVTRELHKLSESPEIKIPGYCPSTDV